MNNFESNYGYGISRSYAGNNVQLGVYRYGNEIGIDGVERPDQKSGIAYFEATGTAERDISTIMPGVSAAVARTELNSFLAQHPDSKATWQDGIGRLHREADAEISAAWDEADAEYKAREARRDMVALAVAGMDLATADEMAALEAHQLASEQTVPVQE